MGASRADLNEGVITCKEAASHWCGLRSTPHTRSTLQIILYARALLAVLGLALASTAFAYVLYFRILASAGATNLSLVTMLVPPTAIILGILILGEILKAHHLAGLALIVAGLLMIDGRLAAFGRDRR